MGLSPDFEFVDQLFIGLCDQPEAKLKPAETVLINVYHTYGLIQNGGMHNFFCETEMDLDLLAGDYQKLDTPGVSNAFDEGVKLFKKWKKREWPRKTSDANRFRKDCGDQLDEIERPFYDGDDQLVNSLAKFANDNIKTT